MARIRVTRELLEHLLDLPEGISVVPSTPAWAVKDGHLLIMFEVSGNDEVFDVGPDATYALQYEETEHGTSLVSAIPVPE